MEEQAKIFEALSNVMDALDDMAKNREGLGADGKKYSYRGLDDIVNEVKPIFKEQRIRIRIRVLESSREIVENSRRRRLFKTVLRVEFAFVATDGSSEAHIAEGEAVFENGNGTKAATSNALKTCLEVMFLISTGEDPQSAGLNSSAELTVAEALEELRKVGDPEAWSDLHNAFERLHSLEEYQFGSEAIYEEKFGKIDEAALEAMQEAEEGGKNGS